MFSEGAETKAPKGILDPCLGFFSVLAEFKQLEGQRQKTLT